MRWPGRRHKESPEKLFAEEVIDLVRVLLGVEARELPGFALAIPQPGSTSMTMNLHNIYIETQALVGEDRASRLRTAVLAMVPVPRPDTWKAAAPLLLPAIRPTSWAAAGGANTALCKRIAPFVVQMLVLDSEHSMTYVTDDDLSRWGVDAGFVHQTAVRNLLDMPFELERHGAVAAVLGPDGYTSSWLAAPAILASLGAGIGAPVIALASDRDDLRLVTASDTSAITDELVRALRDFGQHPRRLSPVPYVVAPDAIAPWDPPPDHPARLHVERATSMLAMTEYSEQQAVLDDLHGRLGEDVFIAEHNLVEREDQSMWSWAAWVRQVTDGLLPRVDYVLLADNEDLNTALCLRWDDALRHGRSALTQERNYDPPLWRHHGWPDDDVLAVFRSVAVPFPPP